MQVLITNGGPHPADKWADTTANAILDLIQITDDSDTPEAAAARQAKRELSPALFKVFYEAHLKVQHHERGELAKEGISRCAASLKTADTEHAPGIMKQIKVLLAATPFKEHFAKPEVIAVVRQIVGQHIANNMHIERCWHADRLENQAEGA